MLRALDLPEILFRIGLYLDAKEVLACSSVCRSFYSSFSPLVWQDIHFGHLALYTKHDTPHEDSPWRRCISYNRIDIKRPNQELFDILQKNAGWMRSLTFGDHDSHHHFSLGRECSRLESLTITRPSMDDPQTSDSWHSCKTLIKQNRHSLRSLTLMNWKSESTKPLIPGQTLWNPILSCSKHMNLRSLVLIKCRILGRQLDALWTICSRLESLELDEVDMDLSLPASSFSSSISTKTPSQHDNGVAHVRFPHLQTLIIRRMRRAHPLRQLELLIRPCPQLRTLCWSIDWFRPFPSNRFCHLFTSLTWPDLDSIKISGHGSRIDEHDQTRLLEAAKRPFRLLDLGAQATVPRPKCGT